MYENSEPNSEIPETASISRLAIWFNSYVGRLESLIVNSFFSHLNMEWKFSLRVCYKPAMGNP